MPKSIAGPEIERVIQLLSRLPGLGPRSARKAGLALVKRRHDLLEPLAEALAVARDRIVTCSVCGNLDTTSPCAVCNDDKRDPTMIVVVEEIGDLWALERVGAINARYHILGGHLSPLDGIGPEQLAIPTLLTRCVPPVSEVLIALSQTVEGQSTAHYLSQQLTPTGVKVSALARGVPVGGELDYLDEGTIAAAIKSRRPV
jgi:recombination protein RecR